MEQSADWVEDLIKVVQSKPALYDKRQKEHSDRNIVAKMWDEVCKAIRKDWNDLSLQEKSIKGKRNKHLKGKEIQQRWRNLRTCFKRELNNQTREKSGIPRNKRRRYIYFDQLLFLLPTLSDRETANDMTTDMTSKNDPEEQLQDEPASPHQVPQRSEKRKKVSLYKESPPNHPMEQMSEEIDEDKTFLLSLVPLFKTLTDKEKLEAKVEFLRVLKRIKYSAS